MSELGDRMALIVSTLRTQLPARVITRDLADFADRATEDLARGVITVLSKGEGGYANYPGRAAMDGRQEILIVGQQELAESAAPSAIEDAEFALIEDVQGFLRALPATLCRLDMRAFRQSMQLDHPYAWVAIDLEYIP